MYTELRISHGIFLFHITATSWNRQITWEIYSSARIQVWVYRIFTTLNNTCTCRLSTWTFKWYVMFVGITLDAIYYFWMQENNFFKEKLKLRNTYKSGMYSFLSHVTTLTLKYRSFSCQHPLWFILALPLRQVTFTIFLLNENSQKL